MKKSVGLVVLTHSLSDGFKVVLQRRGGQDSYPGACQVSAHGGLEENEDFLQALIRESNEELGVTFTSKHIVWKDNGPPLTELVHVKDEKRKSILMGYCFPNSRFPTLSLNLQAAG